MKGLPSYPTSPNRRFSTILTLLLASFLAMLSLLSLLSLSACALSPRKHCYHGYSSDFSFSANADLDRRSSWMSQIPDIVNISSLSIPGTHDTMTYDMVTDDTLQCQNKNLSVQLRAGLRYFDIRGRLSSGTIWIYHSYSWTGHTFTDVLLEMFDFLEQNPSEAIIMRLKEEGGPVGDDSGNTFEQVFLRFLNEDPTTAAHLQKHLFLPPARAFTPLPTLGDLRGRILLLQEFPTEMGGPYGVVWDSPQMALEDLWQIPSADHLWQKWNAVEDALVKARDREDDNSVLFVSHLSCAFGVLPIEAAAGPLGSREILGVNDQTGKWLADEGDRGRTGVVIIDFPGQELIDAVMVRNEAFTEGKIIER